MNEKDAEEIKKELFDYFREDIKKIVGSIIIGMDEKFEKFKNNQIDLLTNRIEELEKIISDREEELLKIKIEIRELKKNKDNSYLIRDGKIKIEENVISNEKTEENVKFFNLGKIDRRFLKTKLNYSSGDKVMEDLKADDKNKFFYRVDSSDGYFDIFPIKDLSSDNLRYLESFFYIDKKNQGEIKVIEACRIASTSYGYYYFVSKGRLII